MLISCDKKKSYIYTKTCESSDIFRHFLLYSSVEINLSSDCYFKLSVLIIYG